MFLNLSLIPMTASQYFSPFKTMSDSPSFFEVEFYIEGVFYKLSLKINSERVLSEILYSRRGKRWVRLYSREYASSSHSYTFHAENINLEDNFIEKVRPNASVISTARQYNHPELTKIRDHWAFISFQPKSLFKRDLYSSFLDASEFYSQNEDCFQKVKHFLKNVDLGLLDIQIETREREDLRGNKKNIFLPYGLHKSKDKEFQLSFPSESGGTLHLYDMLSVILPALNRGTICLIDEIEMHLHPNMLPSVIDLFVSTETNPNDAQLICTTHMPTLMSELSKYQIFLVEKNKECESKVYRLDELEGVRNDDNLFKKYLAGAYGGTPDIDG